MPSLLPALLAAALLGAHPSDPPAMPAAAPAPVAAGTSAPAASAPAAPVTDAKAEALLLANEKAMLALKSYRAECLTKRTFPPSPDQKPRKPEHEVALLVAVKPNLMRYDCWEATADATGTLRKKTVTPSYTFAANGKKTVRQFGNIYQVDSRVQPALLYTISEPWGGFYHPAWSQRVKLVARNEGLKELRYAGQEAVDGTSCDVIAYKYHADYGDGQDYNGKLFIGPDKLVRRQIETIQFGGKPGYTHDAVLRGIKTNFAPPPAKTFAYKPPPGVNLNDPVKEAANRPKLLAAGTPAPDFTVQDSEGKPVKLSDFRGKTVVLDFWATWCGPCMSAMPHTNDAGKKFREKNVVVVAVNVWDEKAAFDSWVPKNKDKYDSIVFLLDPKGRNGDVAKTLYNVSGIPTQYVIDPQGVIRASFVGYDDDPKPLEDAITKASEGK